MFFFKSNCYVTNQPKQNKNDSKLSNSAKNTKHLAGDSTAVPIKV